MYGALAAMDDIWHIHHGHSTSHVMFHRLTILVDFQVLEGFEDGVMDAVPSMKAWCVQLGNGHHVREHLRNEDVVLLLDPLLAYYSAFTVDGATVNTKLKHNCYDQGRVSFNHSMRHVVGCQMHVSTVYEYQFG